MGSGSFINFLDDARNAGHPRSFATSSLLPVDDYEVVAFRSNRMGSVIPFF